MDRSFDFNLNATGNVSPCRFVKLDTTADLSCAAAGSNEAVVGISGEGSRIAPGTPGDDGYIAIATETVPVFGPGRKCLLELGGTVTRGDRLKSGAAGVGVAAATTGTTRQEIGAVALQSGISGQKILVVIQPYTAFVALS